MESDGVDMTIAWQIISESLYEHDPMNTCCKENGCPDEYDFVAQNITHHLEHGLSLESAIYLSLMRLFGELLAKEVDVKAITESIRIKQRD